MMFGVPAAALAMVQNAPPGKRKFARSVLLSGAICSFVCGVTEPFEFAFMFAAPGLYFIYALMYGIFSYVTAICGFRAGFAFSGGVTDLIFSSSLPAAQNTWMILPLGAAAFIVFYAVFRFMIVKFRIKTPGCEDDGDAAKISGPADVIVAGVNIAMLLQGLGGRDNLTVIDNCITRLRLEVADMTKISEDMIKAAGAKGIMRIGSSGLQVIIGLNVQPVADALKIYEAQTQPPEAARSSSKAAPPETEPPGKTIIRCNAGEIHQPVRGRVIPLEEMPDETFASGVLGKGVGICPEDDKAVAPFDGIVINVPDTRHAIALESNGMEVLIHIGIDTVKMKGDGFTCLVREGDAVKAGQVLLRFDRNKIKAAGLSGIIAVTLTNSDDLKDVVCIP